MKYKQLTLKEQYYISTLLERGWRQKDIAESIGVHPSTICREIHRNKDMNIAMDLSDNTCIKRLILLKYPRMKSLPYKIS